MKIGDEIKINNQTATVRFVGTTHFKDGQWVGVELPVPEGKNDGSVQGQRYFQCGSNHGLFLPLSRAETLRSVKSSLPRPASPSGSPAVKVSPSKVKPQSKKIGSSADSIQKAAQQKIALQKQAMQKRAIDKQLETQVKELQDQKAQLQVQHEKEILEKNKDLEALLVTLSEQEKSNTDLTARLAQLSLSLDQKEHILQDKTSALSSSQGDVQLLQTDLQVKSQELEQLRQVKLSHSEVEAQLQSVLRENDQLQKSLTDQQLKLDEMIKVQEGVISDLKKTMVGYEAQMLEQARQLAEAQDHTQQSSEYVNQLKESQAQQSRLQNELEKSQAQIETLSKQQLEQVKAVEQESALQLKELRHEFEKKELTLKQQIEQLQDEHKKQLEEVEQGIREQHESHLKRTQSELDLLHKNVLQTSQEELKHKHLLELNKLSEMHKSELELHKGSAEEKAELVKQLQQQYETSIKEVEDLKHQVNHLQDTNDQLQLALDDMLEVNDQYLPERMDSREKWCVECLTSEHDSTECSLANETY